MGLLIDLLEGTAAYLRERKKRKIPPRNVTQEAIVFLSTKLVSEKCIHRPMPGNTPDGFGYCGECPLSDIGDGGERPDRELSLMMCNHKRDYHH